MQIKPFGVEIWMNEYETKCELNLAETCVASITLGELVAMSGRNQDVWDELQSMRMGYGAIEGHPRLRALIAGLYSGQSAENVITTHGTIGANALVHAALVEKGDHVISVVPTYQQHYSIPESIGADIEHLRLRPENDFLPDLAELRAMIRPTTKLIALNNPNNPTGALMSREMLAQIAEIARAVGAWVLCDEVYRGTDQIGDGYTASIVDVYEKGISTAGMSKAYSLAGLRLGWVVAPREVIEAVMIQRDYNTISVGQIDEYFAIMALENRDKIMARAHRMTRDNLAIVTEWMAGEPLLSWVRPKSGTTALIKFDLPMSSRAFCVKLLEEEGVMLTPGEVMEMEGWLRLGYTNPTNDLVEGLRRISDFLRRHG